MVLFGFKRGVSLSMAFIASIGIYTNVIQVFRLFPADNDNQYSSESFSVRHLSFIFDAERTPRNLFYNDDSTNFDKNNPAFLPTSSQKPWMDWIKNEDVFDSILRTLELHDISKQKPHLTQALGLTHGILYVASGHLDFLRREVIPTIQHLRRGLGIPDAAERSQLRQQQQTHDNNNMSSEFGYAIVVSSNFIEPMKEAGIYDFFDQVLLPEDLPDDPPNWYAKDLKRINFTLGVKHAVKSVKVHAMAHAPFEYTMFLDFDTTPCRADFAQYFFQYSGSDDSDSSSSSSYDIALTNKLRQMETATGWEHWMAEHASSLVVLNMTSVRTRALLQLYVKAFEAQRNIRHDQSSLMVALRTLSSASNYTTKSSWADSFVETHGPIQHLDIPGHIYCRQKTNEHMSCQNANSQCAAIHKPFKYSIDAKVFGIGFKKTSTSSLNAVFKKLASNKEQVCCRGGQRSEAGKQALYEHNTTLALNVARNYRFFQDTPWHLEEVYQPLARKYPLARFILTTRNTTSWWESVQRWTKCKEDNPNLPNIKPGDWMEKYRALLKAKSTSGADMMEAYDNYNARVRAFFQSEPHRLLEMDFSDPQWKNGRGWQTICEFLQREGECPTTDLPKVNETPQNCRTDKTLKEEDQDDGEERSGNNDNDNKKNHYQPISLQELKRLERKMKYKMAERRKLEARKAARIQQQQISNATGTNNMNDGTLMEAIIQRQHERGCPLPNEQYPSGQKTVTNLAIARAASTTLTRTLRQQSWAAVHHRHSCNLLDIVKFGAKQVVLTLRDPVERIESGYRRRIEGHNNKKSHGNGNVEFNALYNNPNDGLELLAQTIMEGPTTHTARTALLGQNFLIPISGYYLQGWKPLHPDNPSVWVYHDKDNNGIEYTVDVAFVCVSSFTDDLRKAATRFGYELMTGGNDDGDNDNDNDNDIKKIHVSKTSARFSAKDAAAIRELYAEDVQLVNYFCGGKNMSKPVFSTR